MMNRDEFFADYWDYRPGEHVSLIYPTRRGKSHLAYQLLDHAMRQNPDLNVVSLMPKPSDPATQMWAEKLELKEVSDWPPKKNFWEKKPRGYVLWPKHYPNMTAEEDREQVADKLRKVLHQQYWKGDSITFADDVHLLAVLMKLNPELEQYWTAGGSNNAGLFSANQKPSGTQSGGSVSSFSYNAPSHLFLGRDTDHRNIRRFGEIGGVEPEHVEDIVRHLELRHIDGNSISDVLYIDKRIPAMCVLTP